MLTGIGLVRVLGRRLIPIERDQPTQFITYPTGLNLMPGSGEGNRNVDWSQITTYATADYYRLHRPIRLLSRTVVGTRAQLLIVIDAITAGYDYLKRDIVRHLRREHQQLEWFHLDFGFFDRIWMTIIGMLALIVGITQPIKTTAQHVTSSEKYYLAFTPVVLSALLALLLLFPTITCWRLLLHRLQFRRVVGYALPSIVPQWLLWIATAVFSIVLVAWLVYRSQST